MTNPKKMPKKTPLKLIDIQALINCDVFVTPKIWQFSYKYVTLKSKNIQT